MTQQATGLLGFFEVDFSEKIPFSHWKPILEPTEGNRTNAS